MLGCQKCAAPDVTGKLCPLGIRCPYRVTKRQLKTGIYGDLNVSLCPTEPVILMDDVLGS